MITLFSVTTLEYVKVAGYVASGYAAARVWFAKEISYGKRLIALLEVKAKAAEAVIKADVVKVETAVKTDVAKVVTAAETEAKKL
jgi:hypothetical protein